MDLNTNESNVERLTRFQSLQAGHYWRALQEIPEEGIEAGTVLLIQSIRWVENRAHTIILRAHPLKIHRRREIKYLNKEGEECTSWDRYDEHRFLLEDFLAKFEYEPDYRRIRESEVADVQAQIVDLQQELVRTQSTPALMAKVVEDGLRERAEEAGEGQASSTLGAADPGGTGLVSMASGTVAGALDAGVTPASIERMKAMANREHQIAEVKAGWITGITTRIADTVAAMTPFYEEQAAAALAQTEDVRTYVAKLMQGIASLDLYVGKDVEVTTIREGEPAPPEVPITFIQAKLLMDEELAVWADVDEWFDFSKEEAFHEALQRHDGLVEQIFPTERCVVVMATTRRHLDYGDLYTNIVRNKQNEVVFLLVRNGMNIHKVVSPVESHLGAARLFPTQDDQERIFRGMDGTQIKFEDVSYTDKLAKHEEFALHYKRFLLLSCGLDHRLKLFGTFYQGPESFDFLSMDFQERHFRFLHDDDPSRRLGGDTHVPVHEWIAGRNAYLRSGSRVLCSWRQVMNPETAPSACFPERDDRFDRRYTPKEPIGVAIAFKDGGSISVRIEVSGESSKWEDRTFNCKVTLTGNSNYWADGESLGYLCLDAVSPEDLRWYIHNRQNRYNQIFYLRFFKRALKFVEAERLEEADTRARLLRALEEGGIGAEGEREGLVDQAVVAWRAAQRGAPLPKFEDGKAPSAWKSLLDQLYMLAGEGKRRVDAIQAFLEARGLAPLRLVLSGAAKLVAYAAPTAGERDDRVDPHVWVHRITLDTTRNGYVEKSRRWALLPAEVSSETTLHQWDGAGAWSGLQSTFASFEAKQEALATAERFLEALSPFAPPMDEACFDRLFTDWRNQRAKDLEKARYVVNPILAVPIGVVFRRQGGGLNFLCVGSSRPEVLLYRMAPDPERQMQVKERYLRSYRNKGAASESFMDALDEPTDWTLLEVPISAFTKGGGCFLSGNESRRDVGGRETTISLDAVLATWESGVREKKRSFWLAPGLFGEQGPVLDAALGVKADAEYRPCRVWQHELYLSGDGPEPKLPMWFDILMEDRPESPGEGEMLADSVPETKGFGRSRQMAVKPSLRAAVRHINKVVADGKWSEWKAVRSSELPNTPQPPEGVERWYVVSPETLAESQNNP